MALMTASNTFDDLESFWYQLLSRDPHLVQSAFESLPEAGQKAVLEHLGRMGTEPGWSPDQRDSASTALSILNSPASTWDSTNH